MFDLVNQERVKAGLPAFTLDQKLTELARMKSQDMYQNNYFSHTSPTYGSALNMERQAGYSARVMGAENIAKAATTTRAHELFMGSEGHKANILNPLHDSIGIGVTKSGSGVVVTQLFSGD
ncbi:Cysteine-rich secretory protein family protein [Pelotomaculum schinkii]|uniref:Cysteine-rich secretory protein family protein n=2 Tax=Pelotomaculum schinkii TaxID=78350 RepID=A0A4Y7RDJ1_9FIRM|nr:Cysteine-rich secretory protein family protein [Pelotomaculum schinkii]